MGSNVGGAYLEVRPDLTGFADQVRTGTTSSLQQLGDRVSVPINANTAKYEADWSAAGRRIQGSLKNYLELGGITLGAAGAFDIIKSGLQGVVDEQQQARQATNLWGQEGGTSLQKWADSSVTALGRTKGQALDTANTLGNMLMGFGQSSSTALPMAEQLTQRIADIASAAGKAPADVQAAIESALRSGRTATLRGFVPQINDNDIKAMAEKLGFIKPKVDDANITKMKADLAVLNDQITKASKGGSDPQAVELAHERVTAATQAHSEAVLRLGAGSHQALVTEIALQSAEEGLARARAGSVPDQDRINQLVAQRGVLQNDIDTAEAGTLDKLDQNQKSLSIINSLLEHTANLPPPGGDAFKVQQAQAAWDTAKDHLATGLLPDLARFADWVTTHGSDINTFADHLGQFLGAAADDAGKLIGWFTDHPDVAKGLAEGLGGVFAIKKLDEWGHAAGRVIGDVGKVFDSILGNKQMPSMKGGGAGMGAASTVAEMTVGTLIAEKFIGGAGTGAPGGGGGSKEGGPTEGPPILGPNGEPLPASGAPTTETTGPSGEATSTGYRGAGADYGVTKASEGINQPRYRVGGSESGGSGGGAGGAAVTIALTAVAADTAHEHADAARFAKSLQDPSSSTYQDLLAQFEGTRDQQAQGTRDVLDHILEADSGTAKTIAGELTSIKARADARDSFIGQVSSLQQSEAAEMEALTAQLAALQQEDRVRFAQTTGARGAALNLGIGSVTGLQLGGSGKGLVSRDVGGDIPFTGPILAHGGEWVETTNERRGIDQLLLSVGELVAQLRGGVGSTQHMAPVFAPQFSGFSTAELENIIRREFGTFARIMADNQQRGLPALHGIVSQ